MPAEAAAAQAGPQAAEKKHYTNWADEVEDEDGEGSPRANSCMTNQGSCRALAWLCGRSVLSESPHAAVPDYAACTQEPLVDCMCE
jgi:hypothetical protein